MTELRTGFHQRMESIEGDITLMIAYVAEDLAAATQRVLSGDADLTNDLAERERVIDDLYRRIDEVVTNQIALQAPVAGDLRFFMTTLRIVPELERSHDLVVHIVRHADAALGANLTPRCRGLVQEMGEVGTDMWRRLADAWVRRDPDAAMLDERDDEMDALHLAMTGELASGHMTVPVTMSMTLIARFFERLGDHAVNIGRHVAYLVGSSNPL